MGLCGRDSSLFFVIPLVLWALAQMRPGITVHAVVENAGSMLDWHKNSILSALNLCNPAVYLEMFDSIWWSAFPRKRFYFGATPKGKPRRMPHRPAPWDQGYKPRRDGATAVIMKG